ncbi:hypothetical protein EJB05_10385 [Eragrostis curvula]|uniref:Plant heme peroxidase family profile domain-containing protein n=1 Tax=Eragrostis curvula TaxID=38414 RepID=A0A5J9VNS5_9POAL|nr:hypothetical protein EJB05_10385 [Eragrostis curvula]
MGRMRPVVVVVVVGAALLLLCSCSYDLVAAGPGELVLGYYGGSCPRAEEIVKEQVTQLYEKHGNTAVSWLRAIFHDCMVKSCDASLLLDGDDRAMKSEKASSRSFGMRNFKYVDVIKAAVERECPGTVSCADVLALAARDGAAMLGGPRVAMRTGRRDSRESHYAEVERFIPNHNDTVSVVLSRFAAMGVDAEGAVALLGAHSVGRPQHKKDFFSLIPRVVLNDAPPLLPFYNTTTTTATAAHNPPHVAPPPPAPKQVVYSSYAAGRGCFLEEEPPLLEELGIDIDRIRRKAVSVLLHPIHAADMDPSLHADPDLSGPLLILLAFTFVQLVVTGRFLLGVALWWVAAASIFLYHGVLKPTVQMDLYRCASLVGYSTLPLMVVFPVLSLPLPRGGVAAMAFGMAFAAWSTAVCVRLLTAVAGDQHRGLLLYPCCLVFMLLALLVIF